MTRAHRWLLRVVGLAIASVSATGFPASAQTAASATTPARQLVALYCISCHNDKLKTGGLALDRADAEHVANSAEIWEKVIDKLRSRVMPPPGMRRPDNAEYDRVAGWLESELDRAAAPHMNPGR